MKVTKVIAVEHRMFPIFFEKENRPFPFYIRADRKMESVSREQHEADFRSFVDDIYKNRPKGFAVTCEVDNFGYQKPEDARANHKRMFSKAQLLRWADRASNYFEEQEYSLDGDFYYLSRRDNKKPVTVESTKAYNHVRCTSVDHIASGNATYCTDELIRKDNIYTNGEVFFLEDYSKPCIFFSKKEIAEKFAAQVNDGNFDELRKLSNDAWSAIKAHHAAAKRAEDEALEAERQEWIKAREAKEAERLSGVDKNSLVLDKNSMVFGERYHAILNDNKVVDFMAAGTHDGCTVGVYQEWSGSLYNEDLNAVMKMFLVDDKIQVFATSQDAHDYQKL